VRLYGLNATDGSAVGTQLRSAADSFVDFSALSTRQIVECLRADDLDLLVEASGYLRGARPEILKARVAPGAGQLSQHPGNPGRRSGGLQDQRRVDYPGRNAS
jgi:hypothetical protein